MKIKKLILSSVVIALTSFFLFYGYDSNASINPYIFEGVITRSEWEQIDARILKSIHGIIYRYNPLIQNKVKIKSSHGIVSIVGIVDTLIDRERTIEIIKTIEGVRGVVDYTILAPIVRPDKEIRNDIIVSFLSNLSVFAPRINVAVSNARVTLSGYVKNPWERAEAINAAKLVYGVIQVNDTLIIASKMMDSDSTLMDELKAMLLQDLYLFDNPISFEVRHGKVILKGTVDTPYEVMRAENQIAVLGIKEINNLLLVKDNRGGYIQHEPFSVCDSEMEKSVKDIIAADERINANNITIAMDHGKISVQGSVGDIYQVFFLEQDIMNVPGAEYVDNRVTANDTSREDKQIVMDIERILRSEPTLAGSQITMTCRNGEVGLSGSMDSMMDKSVLEGTIARIQGVKGIASNLEIENVSANHRGRGVTDKSKGASSSINWEIEIEGEAFHVSVDRDNKTVTIEGVTYDFRISDRAEELVRLRAPKTFDIINAIDIVDRFSS